jgi:hypothetical protein
VRRELRLYAALFAIGLVVYGTLAWGRLGKQSGAPHFVYQADAWLHGSISIAPGCGPCGPEDRCDPPPRACDAARGEMPLPADDWAMVETVTLDDGREVSGRRLVLPRFVTTDGRELLASRIRTPRGTKDGLETVVLDDGREVTGRRVSKFKLLDGEEVALERIKQSRGFTAYVSFPPVPSLLMLPSALVSGRAGGDVLPTVVLAALILPLMLRVLRRLAEAGHSRRTLHDDLWLVALLAFGSVLCFSSVQGKVWYTAHVVGVALALAYAWASIEARHPVIAGLALGAAALTRTSMAFMFPLFLYEAWRMAAKATETLEGTARVQAQRRAMLRTILRFAIPVVAFAIAGMIYNQLRFHSFTEFGHSYLALGDHRPVRQQLQIEQWGLASYHYLARNLSVALTLLPETLSRAPWIQISGHGLALWVTTPALFLLLWPRTKGPLHRVLWLTVLVVALPSLFYMNTGWFQFGYRFSLDYMVFLVMLLAIGDRPLTRVAKTLIIVGIVINLFGALTFDREGQYYRGGNAYDVVVAN